MYSKHLITCINCGREKKQSKHSATGTYCSNKCQQNFQYKKFIHDWKHHAIPGTVGKTGISGHIRRYMFEKYDGACSECGWNKLHPADNRCPLEVEHIDGDWSNTVESNLKLLCPNCHSLTLTYKSRNKGKSTRTYAGVTKRPTAPDL